MSSIRTTLVVMLVAAFFLVSFLASLNGYRASMAEAEGLLDSQLRHASNALRAATPAVDAVVAQDDAEEFVFQIWSGERLLMRSSGAPSTPIATAEPGYRYVNFGGYRWRAFTRLDASGDAVIVAERADVRHRLAERVVLDSVIPLLLWLPISAILTWVLVSWGLRPLREFSRQINAKRSDDLSPIELAEPPAELAPLVDSTNSLLRRLAAAFEREQHFAAHAAHELRTPLSVIKVHLQNLEQELPRDHEGLRHANLGVERMQHLIEQILDLAQTNPELTEHHFSEVDLHALAQRVLAESYGAFSERGQSIALEGDRVLLAADPDMLSILLQNLLDNAGKYAPEGGEVTVFAGKVDGAARLVVSDTGPGIPAGERERVFERFYRVPGGDAAGSGLGLSIVGHIAEIHRGRIALADGPDGRGLSVQIDFPLAEGG
jgi:two-component system sensor histidine kinase QseC